MIFKRMVLLIKLKIWVLQKEIRINLLIIHSDNIYVLILILNKIIKLNYLGSKLWILIINM